MPLINQLMIKMKKTKIIKIITPPVQNNNYLAHIIIPIHALPFNLSSKKILKEILIDLLTRPKNIIRKFEKDITRYVHPDSNIVEIKRSFNLLSDGVLIKITDFEPYNQESINNDIEIQNIKHFLEGFTSNLKEIKEYYFEFTHIIFVFYIEFSHK